MSRTKGILAAGAFTGLILITILALGLGNLQAQTSGESAAVPQAELDSQPVNSSTADKETLRAWQEYSAQLEQAVLVLQQRDTAYQQQLDAANQTILQLQDQINSDPAPQLFEEHEEHEHEEHEAFEFGEFDD